MVMVTQSRPVYVILTRPAAQGARFAELVRENCGPNVRVIISPLMAVEHITPDLGQDTYSAVIFTSEPAVKATQTFHGTLPALAYCVGEHTSLVAQEAGFSTRTANGDAATLIALIQTAQEQGPLVHLRGRDTRGQVAERLNSAGIVTFETIVYAQNPVPLSQEARAVLGAAFPVILPVFSPRSADMLAVALAQTGVTAPLVIVAFSPAVAGRLIDAGLTPRLVASHPDARSMLAAIQQALSLAQPA